MKTLRYFFLIPILAAPWCPSASGAETKIGRSAPVTLELRSLESPKSTGRKNPDGVAVVIGNRNYDLSSRIPEVSYAIRDARAVIEHLIQVFGFRRENIIYIENATKGQLEGVFGTPQEFRGTLYERVKPERSEVFIYYTGHGVPSLRTHRPYILPKDGNPNKIEIRGYALDTLYRNLARLPAKRLSVVLDACFSGDSSAGTLFPKSSARVRIRVKNPLLALPNAFVLTASSGTEVASWDSAKRHGIFTYYFLLGIRGLADSNGNGRISLREVREYVRPRVANAADRIHGRTQTSMIEGPGGTPLVRLR